MKISLPYRHFRKLRLSPNDALWRVVRVNSFSHNVMLFTKLPLPDSKASAEKSV